MLDEQSGDRQSGGSAIRKPRQEGQTYSTGKERIITPRFDSGGASRFFYTAKSSKKERNLGLDNTCTVKYDIPKDILRKDILCKDVSMAAVELLKKVTSELTVKWLIGESGESITALCQRDSLSTILTEISKTIELKTFVWLQHCGINGITGAAKKLVENGGSPAENAGNLKKWLQTSIKGNLELARGASGVVSLMLLKINAKESWQQLTNSHPTVKSLALMEYLCTLTKTPTGGIVLDCFAGSGSTCVACVTTGRSYVGIEKEKEYCDIAEKRIKYERDKYKMLDMVQGKG